MYRMNLRDYKQGLRAEAKNWRISIPPDKKSEMDRAVFENVLKLRQYQQMDTIFIYVSMPAEVDTRKIIKTALTDGKRVAVPRCIVGTAQMVFHYISSLKDLKPGSFSVDEPGENLPVATYSNGAFMIVPALLIDRRGYRLGYGKGYYDRYIGNFGGQTVGLCYTNGFVTQINHGKYDLPVDVVVTEDGICSIKRSKQ